MNLIESRGLQVEVYEIDGVLHKRTEETHNNNTTLHWYVYDVIMYSMLPPQQYVALEEKRSQVLSTVMT